MKSKAFFEYLLVQKPQDAWGELDYNEVKDISYAAEEWQIEKVFFSFAFFNVKNLKINKNILYL